MPTTLNLGFLDTVDHHADDTAFLVKRDGRWRSLSYGWALEQAQRTAFGLVSLGFERGSRLGILAENRPEWATTDVAAMAAGHLVVPLYTTLLPDQVAYILHDAGTRLVFVSTMAHLETILSIRDRLPALEKVVVFYPEGLEEDDFVISLDTLKERGDGHTRAEYEELAGRARPDDPATFVYTSGTTGNPKGVVLTHDNFAAELVAVEPMFEGRPGDMVMSFLPLSHILQRITDWVAVTHGMTVAYAESLDTLGANLREVRPSHIVAVPRVYEKIHGRILEGVRGGSALKQRIFTWALGVGHRYREARALGAVPVGLALRHSIAEALVFKKIRAATGGRLEHYYSSGAPLAKELGEFFHAVGITILEVWGMTELTGAATISTMTAYRFGTVGKPGPGVELRLEANGEICVRGGIVLREYWGMPEATTELIDADGWVHTGDVGFVDDDGFVNITDRIRELIVTAGGKNVPPQPLENALKTHPLIAQAMAIGDRRNFITALVVPDREALNAWAEEHGVGGGLASRCADPRVVAHYEEVVASIMERFSRYERVRKIALVPDEFTQEAGELTPTLKLKRRVLLQRYADVIDALYAAPPPGAAT